MPDTEKPEIERQQAEGFQLLEPEETPAGPAPLQRAELIRIPARKNQTLQQLVARVNADVDLHAIWRCQNVNAVDRLAMSDHGPVHVQIVANIALRLLRLLVSAGIQPNAVKDHQLTIDDAEVIVFLGTLLHDAGMSIHRDDHETFSLFVAAPKIAELLAGLYPTPTCRVIQSEVLHAIITHRSEGRPLTLEAGVVRLADALDMAEGRSRIPFETGHVNIHLVSAAAIEAVEIGPGEQKPVRLSIHMVNAAGLFQLDELLKQKLRGSGLEPHVEVEADILGDTDKRLFETFRI